MKFVKTHKSTPRMDQPLPRGRHQKRTNDDAFGRFAEAFARYMGTSSFLIGMTILIIFWITWNTLAPQGLVFDPPWFILLNLLFSTQASYAAPLILLAQNRQDERDRVAIEQDRVRDERNLADTEFLAREVSDIRRTVTGLATRDSVRMDIARSTNDQIMPLLEEILERLSAVETQTSPQPR